MSKISGAKLKLVVFSLIGVFNTVFDIALYILFLNLTHSILVANIIATSAALVGSYFLNSRLTFKNKRWSKASFFGFIGVTLFGLWILQTVAIYAFTHLLVTVPQSGWRLFGGLEHTAKLLVPKLLATGVTLVWNYVWYSKVIFRHDKKLPRIVASTQEL